MFSNVGAGTGRPPPPHDIIGDTDQTCDTLRLRTDPPRVLNEPSNSRVSKPTMKTLPHHPLSPALTLTLALAALAVTPACGESKQRPSATNERSDAPPAAREAKRAQDTPTDPVADSAGVSRLVFTRGPLKLLENGKLSYAVDKDGVVTSARGKPAGTFDADGVYTNSKGEFGMAYRPDGTLLRNDRTPFFGKLNAAGNYTHKSTTWSFGPDGTFLINGMAMGDLKVEGVTPRTHAFAMAVMVAVIHPNAEAVVY